MTRRVRLAYAYLALLSLLAGGASAAYSAHLVRSTTAQLCTLLTAATATPVHRPLHPARAPAQEATWEWQQRYLAVERAYRC